MVFQCELVNKTTDWWNQNKDRIFPEFDTLSESAFSTNGITKTEGLNYADMRLISNDLNASKNGPVVDFVYETLTTSWEKEVEDVPSATESGLRLLTRVRVARQGSTKPHSEDGVGISTITDNGKTLYLAGFEDQSTDRIGRFVTRWAEAGLLDFSESYDLEGLETLSYTFIGQEGATDGRVTFRRTSNFQGFRTYIVRTLRKIGGSTVVDNEVVETIGVYHPWTFPGIANAVELEVTSSPDPVRKIFDIELDHPVTPPLGIPATAEIRYQNDSNIGTLPYPVWNPMKWAKYSAYWLSNNLEPTSRYGTLGGYRTGVGTKAYTGGATQVSFLGRFVYAAAGAAATINISGGPANPVGNTYIIAKPRVEHAFTEKEPGGGIVKWYRRTIVYATIPDPNA